MPYKDGYAFLIGAEDWFQNRFLCLNSTIGLKMVYPPFFMSVVNLIILYVLIPLSDSCSVTG